MQQGNLSAPDQVSMPEPGRKSLSVRTHIRAGKTSWNSSDFPTEGQLTTPYEAEDTTMPSSGYGAS